MIYMQTSLPMTIGTKMKATKKKSITEQVKNQLFAQYFMNKQCTATLLMYQNNTVVKHN